MDEIFQLRGPLSLLILLGVGLAHWNSKVQESQAKTRTLLNGKIRSTLHDNNQVEIRREP